MPYADPQKRAQAKREYYLRNKEICSERVQIQKHKKRQYVSRIKDQPCMDCDIKYPYYVMDLDHREGVEKIKSIAQMVIGYSWDDLLKEIAKCDVVCANCHRIRTWQRRMALSSIGQDGSLSRSQAEFDSL